MHGPSQEDLAGLAALRGALMGLHEGFSAFVNSQGILPTSQSQAHLEEDHFLHPESIQTVVAQANQLIEVAGDHLTAFVKTITAPMETLAPWTCVRAILESGAVVAWLLDPSLNAERRVGRSLALRHEGLEQQRKYCALKDATVATRIEERIAEVEEQAASWGFSRLIGRDGRRTGIGVPMPPSTALVRDALNEEAMYRLLSGVVHGHFWAAHNLGFRLVSAPDTAQVPGYRTSQKHVNVPGIRALAATTAAVISRVAWWQCTYYGWEHDELRGLLEPVIEQLDVPTHKRPWS